MDEQSSPVVFFEWFKRRRKALGLTQDELALRAGCSVSALRKIESGERRPSKQLAELLAQALEIPVDEQKIFIQVARGGLNLERLRQPAAIPIPSMAEVLPAQQTQEAARQDKIAATPASRLPLQATPLVGRERELLALERLIHDPQCRLLTLTGIGGIGKTRLAIEFAFKNQPAFPGGVFYIPLALVDSGEKVAPAIADVLGFGFSVPTDPKEQLLIYLASWIHAPALFIFDNLEHLLLPTAVESEESSLADLVLEFLERLPEIKILGTSRERLNLHGEWTYELQGLSVPPANFAGQWQDYAAVTLFVKSAMRSKADFQAGEVEQAAIIQVCQLVEGVPLAIELAAAWVGVLSCQEIAQEIKANLDFLSTSMRDMPERHRSIRATFDHSWRLLSDEERWVLCQLAVFHGGFDRQAAQQIAGATLPLLASLSAKSLISHSESGRYDVHIVIRQYALPHLEAHPQSLRTYERHCEYFLHMLRDREPLLRKAAQQRAIRELTDEIGNIRAAWAWAIQHKQFALLEEAGRAVGWYYEVIGVHAEGVEQLEMLLQALEAEAQDQRWQRIVGQTMVQLGLLYFRKGEFEAALKYYEQSLQVLRPAGDQVLLADALIYLGIILHLRGEYARSKELLEEGLILARSNNEGWYEAYAIYNLGYIASLMGDYELGYEQMLEGLTEWRKLGDPHYIALGLNFLVTTLIQLGRCEEAITFMHESIRLCEQSKNRWGKGTAYRYLGLAYLADDQFEEAKAQLLKSLEIFSEYTKGWDIILTLTYLGDVALRAGDYAEAGKIYQDTLASSIEVNALPNALENLAGLGDVYARTGEPEIALLLCYTVLDHPFSEEGTRGRAERLRSALELELTAEQVEKVQTQAKQTPFGVTVKTALGTR